MIIRKEGHELLKLVLSFLTGGGQKLLYDFEDRHNVPLLRLTEFCDEKDSCGQQALRGIIEVCILPEAGGVHAGQDDRL